MDSNGALVTALAVLLPIAGLAAAPETPAPLMGASIAGLNFRTGWTDPRALAGDINTAGWEDSAFVSADGGTLYFGYTPLDYDALVNSGQAIVAGPLREGQHGTGFDIWEAVIFDGAWSLTDSTANANEPELHEAAIGVNRDQTRMAFIRFDPEGDIYLSDRLAAGAPWGPPEKLPWPVNTGCVEDNPHLSGTGDVVFFDSDRADAGGSVCTGEERTIYVTRFVDNAWTAPKPLAGAPNETPVRWQVFLTLDESAVYWTGSDTDCPAANCVYRARRAPDGSYRGRELVAVPTPFAEAGVGDTVALGEISITADGRWFYFVYAWLDAPGHLQLDLGVARRRPTPPRRARARLTPR